MIDKIEKIGSSVLHHGPNSNRIYLMKFDESDLKDITKRLNTLAIKNRYTKIIVKIPFEMKDILKKDGYEQEAYIPKLFNGQADGCFMCRYLDEARKIDIYKDKCEDIINTAQQKEHKNEKVSLDEEYLCRNAQKSDIKDIVDLYKEVFKSYPFPIFEEEYILQTMQENVFYFGIWHKNKLVGLSSIELDKKNSNAEMTDFAVLNEYRGHKFALYLLEEMEKNFEELNIKTAFTIARAKSTGMNITFAKKGYKYAGTLINNTDIAGQIESMNVWYKNIS